MANDPKATKATDSKTTAPAQTTEVIDEMNLFSDDLPQGWQKIGLSRSMWAGADSKKPLRGKVIDCVHHISTQHKNSDGSPREFDMLVLRTTLPTDCKENNAVVSVDVGTDVLCVLTKSLEPMRNYHKKDVCPEILISYKGQRAIPGGKKMNVYAGGAEPKALWAKREEFAPDTIVEDGFEVPALPSNGATEAPALPQTAS